MRIVMDGQRHECVSWESMWNLVAVRLREDKRQLLLFELKWTAARAATFAFWAL